MDKVLFFKYVGFVWTKTKENKECFIYVDPIQKCLCFKIAVVLLLIQNPVCGHKGVSAAGYVAAHQRTVSLRTRTP